MSEKRPVRLVKDELEFEYMIEEVVIHHQKRLEGRLKTFVEAITKDERAQPQKDILGQLLWMEVSDLIEELACLRIDSAPGMKIAEVQETAKG